MKPKHIFSALFVIFSVTNSSAQEPLLLETTEQTFNQQTQEWKDEAKTTFAYDQKGNMIRKFRKLFNICDIVNDPDCYFSGNPTRVSNEKSWKYNERDQVTFYSEEELGYIESANGWKFGPVKKETIETKYNEDSLVLEHFGRTESMGLVENTIRINRYNDNRAPVLKLEIYKSYNLDGYPDEDTYGDVYRDIYEYEGELKTSWINEWLEFKNEDTTFHAYTKTEYHYNSQNLKDYEVSIGQDQKMFSKNVFIRNEGNLVTKIEGYVWNSDVSDWELNSVTDTEYHNNGIKNHEIERYRYYGENRYRESSYDDKGRQIQFKSELYDDEWNFIKETGRSTTVYFEGTNYRTYYFDENRGYSYILFDTFNEKGQTLEHIYQWWHYTSDSVLESSSIDKQVFEYDVSGYLIEKQSFWHIYDADSILSVGCCGGLYDLYESYENRCDGAPLIVTSEQWYYEGGSDWVLEPGGPKLRRELNKFSKSICDLNEPAVSFINAYPNPTNSVINIDSELFQSYGTKLDFVDLSGKTLISEMAPVTNSYRMDLSTLAPGVYVLKLTGEQGSAEQKIVFYR